MFSIFLLAMIIIIILLLQKIYNRVDEVVEYRLAIIDQIAVATKSDNKKKLTSEWRFEIYDQVGFNEMVWMFWKPVNFFWKDYSFINSDFAITSRGNIVQWEELSPEKKP